MSVKNDSYLKVNWEFIGHIKNGDLLFLWREDDLHSNCGNFSVNRSETYNAQNAKCKI